MDRIEKVMAGLEEFWDLMETPRTYIRYFFAKLWWIAVLGLIALLGGWVFSMVINQKDFGILPMTLLVFGFWAVLDGLNFANARYTRVRHPREIEAEWYKDDREIRYTYEETIRVRKFDTETWVFHWGEHSYTTQDPELGLHDMMNRIKQERKRKKIRVAIDYDQHAKVDGLPIEAVISE